MDTDSNQEILYILHIYFLKMDTDSNQGKLYIL